MIYESCFNFLIYHAYKPECLFNNSIAMKVSKVFMIVLEYVQNATVSVNQKIQLSKVNVCSIL